MNSLVFNKGWALTKGFPTFLTFIGSFSSVCYHVSSKGCKPCEGFSAFLTFIEFFSSVTPFMSVNRFVVTEGFPTFLAFIWFLFVLMILIWFVYSVRSDVPIKK